MKKNTLSASYPNCLLSLILKIISYTYLTFKRKHDDGKQQDSYMLTFGEITVRTPLRALFKNRLSFMSPAIDFVYNITTTIHPHEKKKTGNELIKLM